MAMKKVNYRVKAGIAAVVFALGGSTLPGNVCINAPATVQAEEGTGAESASQQVINLNTSWKYLDNNTDPAAGLGSLTAWTAAGFGGGGKGGCEARSCWWGSGCSGRWVRR